jgi:hypothetical protein
MCSQARELLMSLRLSLRRRRGITRPMAAQWAQVDPVVAFQRPYTALAGRWSGRGANQLVSRTRAQPRGW